MKLLKKSLLILSTLFALFVGSGVFAQTIGTDIALSASLPGSWTQIAQYASPSLNVFLMNKGTNGISGANLSQGFLTCTWTNQNLIIYQSPVISQLTINPGTSLKKVISLNSLFTQALWDKDVTCVLKNRPGESVTKNNTAKLTLSVTDAGRFDLAITKAIDPIKNNLDAPEIKSGVEWVNNFLITKVMNVLVPLIILVAILTAMFGFYKLFFATDDKAISSGVKLIGFWVLGIIVIMSANFFATTLYSKIFMEWNLWYGSLQGYEIAQKLYEDLLFPFIKIAIYLSVGVLFVMLASRVITFVFGSDDDTRKKAGTIITWNVIGMLVIIWAKQLVEFVYGKQADVVKSVSNLWEIWSGLLATKNFPFLYQVINWAMGLSSLLILIMVLFQAFQLLMKPDAPDAMKKIKNSLLYIFIGIIIIGTGYIITNFLIIN